ncbi:hypothetical protein C7M84_008860 [Penaeus vannamei]|nr:uncharacterized protein LOC113810409 [Penaeus vannamei]XP_027217896.1 uncharacterized protein LOC113810410 [Penaeus vannamei]ROT72745.1 hypothetical protein C7M84_008860 [Penaeus vannamei]
MRASLLLVFALAALVAAAEAKKCKGECVSAGSCEGTEAKGKCDDSQVCCVTEGNVDVKGKCHATSECDDLLGECRAKSCHPGEVTFKNKGTNVYCEGKKCVCCAKTCENKKSCNLKGGVCQPISQHCDGTLETGKPYCKASPKMKAGNKNTCGCCIPPAK